MKNVCICITLDTYAPSPFLISWINMERIGKNFKTRRVVTTYGVLTYDAMNEATKEFLRTDCDHLLFLESDMRHPQDTIARLLKHNLPIVGGIQTYKMPPFAPMMYRLKPPVLWGVGGDTQLNSGPYKAITDWKRGELLEVDGIATGCLMVKREVMEKLKFPWFTFAEGTQDFNFCRHAQEAGFTIHCDTSIECGHMGLVTFGVDEYLRYKEAHKDGA